MRRACLGGLLCLAVLMLAGCGKELPTASGAEGEERVVLAELFTAVWCGNCPFAEGAIEKLYDEQATLGAGGTPRLAVIQWHPSLGQGDPFAIAASDARIQDYDDIFGPTIGLPMAIFNGVTGIDQGSAETYAEYRAQFEQYAQLPARVRLELTVTDNGDHVHPAIRLQPVTALEAAELSVTAVLVEDRVANTSGMGPDTLGFVARVAQSEEVALSGTEPVDAPLLTLPVHPDWVRRNLYVVAFAQEAGTTPGHDYREVLQATMTRLAGGAPYAFVATGPEGEIGIPAGGERRIPFEIRNTGVLDDTLVVDIPATLIDVPAGWTIGLSDAEGHPLAVPHAIALASGSTLGDLRIVVNAPAAGTGSAALTITSRGDPALVVTLQLALAAGVFGLDLSAEATAIELAANVPYVAPFAILNTGTLTDSVRVFLPAELDHLPEGWTTSLIDSNDVTLGTGHTLRLGPSDRAGLGLRLTAADVGKGTLGLVAVSRTQPAVADTIVFTVEARAYNLRLRAESQVWIVVGERTLAPFEIRNTGSRDDLVRLTLPAELQALPVGWTLGLAYGDTIEIETPYALPLEAGTTADGFRIAIRADAAGQGIARLVATSSGDPSLSDTLVLAITADAYGFSLSAPGGTEIELAPGEPASIPIVIANTGTLADTLTVDRLLLQDLPTDWDVFLADAVESPVTLPRDLPLPSGAAQDGWHVRAVAGSAGNAIVTLVVTSQARPALSDTLRLHLSVTSSDYAFDLTAEETVLHIAPGSYPDFFTLPFDLTSRGQFDDTIQLQMSWVTQPSGWTSIPIICDEEGTCYGPFYDAAIAAGGVVDNLVADLFVPGVGGTAVVRVTATSAGDRTQVHSLDLTFTTDAPVRSAPARPAGATLSTIAETRPAGAAARQR